MNMKSISASVLLGLSVTIALGYYRSISEPSSLPPHSAQLTKTEHFTAKRELISTKNVPSPSTNVTQVPGRRPHTESSTPQFEPEHSYMDDRGRHITEFDWKELRNVDWGNLVKEARPRPMVRANGTLAGVLLSELDASPLLSRAGIQPGDLVTGINGETLEDMPQAFGLFAQALNNPETELTVLRNGEARKLVITGAAETEERSEQSTEAALALARFQREANYLAFLGKASGVSRHSNTSDKTVAFSPSKVEDTMALLTVTHPALLAPIEHDVLPLLGESFSAELE